MTKFAHVLVLIALALAVSAIFAAPVRAADEKAATGDRLFEMRTYHAATGKLDDLNARFRDHTNALFARHGITIIGFWVPTEGPDANKILVYILAYPNKEARDKSWKDFQADPDWKKAQSESEKNGKLVTKVDQLFMSPTDYSPIK